MHAELRVVVPGIPVPKARARSALIRSKSGKQFISHYTPKSTRNFEQEVRGAAFMAMVDAKLQPAAREVPVELGLLFVMPIPASWSQRKTLAAVGAPVIVKPDLDNLEKSIKDGCNGVVWVDDCQVWNVFQKQKVYGADPRVEIVVRW